MFDIEPLGRRCVSDELLLSPASAVPITHHAPSLSQGPGRRRPVDFAATFVTLLPEHLMPEVPSAGPLAVVEVAGVVDEPVAP